MKKFKINFSNLLLLLLILAGWFIYKNPQTISPIYHSVCAQPLPYKIGNIDPRFNLDASQVNSDISQATDIWSKVENHSLFKEDPQNSQSLTVNFVYDKRQELNSQINQLQNQLNQQKQNLDPQIQAFESKKSAFESSLASLNNEIESWNARGGAPPDVYQDLKNQQSALKSQADELNSEAKSLNLSAQDYNSGVNNLNQTIQSFDTALAKKPEEGLYDPVSNTITIYFVNSQSELVHTLTHEFGHYLGLDHNSDEASIMYPYTNISLTPSAEDLANLSQVCSLKQITVPLINFKSRTF